MTAKWLSTKCWWAFLRRLRKKSSGAAKRVPEGSGGTGRFRVEEVSEGSWVPDVFSLKLLVFLGPKNVPAKGLGEAGMPAGGFERVWKVLQGWWRCLKAWRFRNVFFRWVGIERFRTKIVACLARLLVFWTGSGICRGRHRLYFGRRYHVRALKKNHFEREKI